MKPPAFGYVAPSTVQEAVLALRDLGGGAKILAEGQSLIPLLNFRLSAAGAPRKTRKSTSSLPRAPSGALELEMDAAAAEFEIYADVVHHPRDLGASIPSGSFLTAGTVGMPCSMKTLAAVATGYTEELATRAAVVCLKERRRLVLVTRETPSTCSTSATRRP